MAIRFHLVFVFENSKTLNIFARSWWATTCQDLSRRRLGCRDSAAAAAAVAAAAANFWFRIAISRLYFFIYRFCLSLMNLRRKCDTIIRFLTKLVFWETCLLFGSTLRSTWRTSCTPQALRAKVTEPSRVHIWNCKSQCELEGSNLALLAQTWRW